MDIVTFLANFATATGIVPVLGPCLTWKFLACLVGGYMAFEAVRDHT